MLEIGSLVDGKYRILDEVGRGGMSIVYLARNIRTNKQWAIKEVRKDGTNDFDIVKSNLVAETDILKKLEHPNLPNIIDILDDGDSFVIIMDFIEGNSLQHYLKHAGAQSEEDVVQWGIQLCDVLGYLHSRTPPIIYRDMKPANIMLKPDGNVSLIDFGTAREYKETSVEDTKCLGTQGYAAPEQYGGHGQTDARTDIYCLGATLYHLVTGHNPAEPPYEMYPIRQWNPNLSEGLEYIILKCTQKNPDDRFQSCEELMYALQHREAFDEGVRKENRRKLLLSGLSLLMTVVFTAGAIGSHVAMRNTEKRSYSSYVEMAEKMYDPDPKKLKEASDYYERAAKISPGKPDVYESVIRAILQDSDITTDEYNLVQTLTSGHTGNGITNESRFKAQSPEAYYEFCYKMGLILFSLDDATGYNRPRIYMGQAVEPGTTISDSKKQLAEHIINICNMRASAFDVEQAENSKTYGDYWTDMESIADSDLHSLCRGVEITEKKILDTVLVQMREVFPYFQQYVSPEQMEALLDKVDQKSEALQKAHPGDEAYVKSTDIDKLRGMIASLK